MERKFSFSVDEYYHIYNRGTDKRLVFLDNADRDRFVRLLFVSNSTKPVVFRNIKHLPYSDIDKGDSIVAIGAYCLMPNHFHLLVRETMSGGISAFMGKLLTAYSAYFNKKYQRTGALFESTFRAQHVDNDNYLKYLFAYIHLNPVKLTEPDWKEKGIVNIKAVSRKLSEYHYSSYDEYIGAEREESAILSKEVFPEYFIKQTNFQDFVRDWLEYRDI
ncbi:MAG: transposase [Parcubacteria group bacterium]|nr:transposase [Parcubacteria group bacterium]